MRFDPVSARPAVSFLSGLTFEQESASVAGVSTWCILDPFEKTYLCNLEPRLRYHYFIRGYLQHFNLVMLSPMKAHTPFRRTWQWKAVCFGNTLT